MTWSVRCLAPRILIGLLTPVAFACTEPTGSGRDADRPAAAKAPVGVTVTSVSPDSVPRDTTLDIRVLGSGFDDGSQAEFLLAGQLDPGVLTVSTRFVRSTELVARVTVAVDAVPARYDVQVTTRAGKKGIGTERLTVLAVNDLGSLGGAGSSSGGINDEGSVVGRSDTVGTTQGRAFVWDARTTAMRNLGTLEAYAINNDRSVTGLKAGIGPVRWDYDQATDQWSWVELPSPLGDDAFPLDINQSGAMVGWADGVAGGPSGAILWPDASLYVLLDSTRRWSYTQARALNNQGWIAGYGRNVVGQGDAWVWIPDIPNGTTGTFKVLPRFGAVPDHHAEGINDHGDVVGWAETAQGVDFALLWRRNAAQTNPAAADYYLPPQDLGAALGRKGRAMDVNNAMLVVGRSDRSKNRLTYDPFVWSAAQGMRILPAPGGGDARVERLNESVPAFASGEAMVNGNWHAVRWLLP